MNSKAGLIESTGKRGLPTELLQQISNRFRLRDLQNLRLVNRKLGDIGLKTVQDERKVIFLDISRASIKRFREICSNENFAEGIEEIKYIGCLLHMPAEQIPDDPFCRSRLSRLSRNVPEYRNLRIHLRQRLDMADAELARLKEVLDDHLRGYTRRQEEQQSILESNEIESVLLEAAAKLPNLKTVTYLPGPPSQREWPAYNWDRAWNYEAPNDKDSMEQFMYDLEYDQQHWDPPTALIKVIAQRAQQPSLPMTLHLSGTPLAVLGSQKWKDFLAHERPTLLTAMSHVDRIETILTDLELRDFRNYTPDPEGNNTKLLVNQCLMPLFNNAHNLLEVKAGGTDYESSECLITSLLSSTFPKLQKIALGLTFPWEDFGESERPAYTKAHPQMHTTGSLISFFGRHASTLKYVQLHRACGVDKDIRVPTLAVLSELLESFKSPAFDLRELYVEEITRPGGSLRWADVQEDPDDPDFYESNVRQSSLGRFAEKMGIEGAPATFRGRNCLSFDFGPWVLENDNVGQLRDYVKEVTEEVEREAAEVRDMDTDEFLDTL